MTVDEEREVVMGELWVSHDELVDAIGDDGADLLCRAVGGVSTYIPRKPVAGSPLSAVLGMKRMERLCAAFGGLRVTLPNRRKGEPFKDRIVRMLENGKSPGRIALELGVTERYVRILARQIPGSASGTIPERTPTSSATRGWSSGPTPSARACRCICTRPGWTACGKSSPGCTAFPRSGSGTTTKGSALISH